jgi:hypothetical protein
VAGAVLGHASAQGTPIAGNETGRERLESLLSLVPANLAGSGGFAWSDIAAQAASVGAPMPTGLPQEVSPDFVAALGVLPVGFIVPNSPLDPATHDHFGFSAITAHQELTIWGHSYGPSLLRGGLPLATLPAYWEAKGYQRETTPEGIDIWTVPHLPLAGGTGPNVASPPDWLFAILDDTLVTARDVDVPQAGVDGRTQLGHVLALATTGGASLLDTGGYGDLIATLAAETVAVLGRPGSSLDIATFAFLPPGQTGPGTPRGLVETDPNQVPPVRDLVYAVTGGGRSQGYAVSNEPTTPDASPLAPTEPDPGNVLVQARLRFATADEASQAITTIVARWNTWESVTLKVPYADLLAIDAARPAPEDPTIAAIDFRPIGTPDTWLYIFLNSDVLPLTYVSPSATPLA